MNFLCFLFSADRSLLGFSEHSDTRVDRAVSSFCSCGCSRGAESVRSLLSGVFCSQVLGLYLSALCCAVAGTLHCLTFSFIWEVTIAALRHEDCYVRVAQLSVKPTELLCIAYVSLCNQLNCCRCETIVELTAGVACSAYTEGKVREYGQCGPAWPQHTGSQLLSVGWLGFSGGM